MSKALQRTALLRPARPGRRALFGPGMLRISVLAGVLLCSSCGGPGAASAPGADPERMSQSEYDIARDLWFRRNNPRDALKHALEAVELDENNADAAHLVALLYLDFCRRSPSECRLAQAERYTRKALAAREDYREAKNTLGVVLIHRQRYAEAIEVLKPLTQDILYQTPENAWGNLGWAYLKQGSVDRAVAALERSVAAQPLFCVGNYRLGLAYDKKGQLAKAREALTAALETSDPACRSLQDGYLARARVNLRLGRKDEARADLDRCLALENKRQAGKKQSQAGKECSALLQNLK